MPFIDTSKLKVIERKPGTAGIVPSNTPHSVKALTDGKAIVVDYP